MHNLEVLEGDEFVGTAPLDLAFSGTVHSTGFLWDVRIFILVDLGDSETDCLGESLVALPTRFL